MTEMTRHMMTAMTMPTYSAISSVIGAAEGRGRGEVGQQRANQRILVVPEEASCLICV